MSINKIINSIILLFIIIMILSLNIYSITYAKYKFCYTIDAAEIEIIV